jgi:hypothetical protein
VLGNIIGIVTISFLGGISFIQGVANWTRSEGLLTWLLFLSLPFFAVTDGGGISRCPPEQFAQFICASATVVAQWRSANENMAGPDHSALMFAALMMGHHLSISAL